MRGKHYGNGSVANEILQGRLGSTSRRTDIRTYHPCSAVSAVSCRRDPNLIGGDDRRAKPRKQRFGGRTGYLGTGHEL